MQKNPFDLPNMGFNQENPLFTSMNMMRQMWEGMGTNPMDMSTAAAIPSAEDLEKRIKELKTVENWLRLNLSMLSSTIQGLEIQHSTLSTLQSFAQGGFAAMPGLTEAMSAATMQTMSQGTPSSSKEADKDSESSQPKQAKADDDSQALTDDTAEQLMQAGQAWWGLMQEQFDALAKSTTQSIQQAQAQPPLSDLASAVGNPSADTTFGKTAAKKTAKKTTKTAKKTASKATKSTAPKAAKAAKSAKKTPPPTK